MIGLNIEELINNLKEINSLSEIENLKSINPNILLYAIAKSKRYYLLKGNGIRLNITDSETLKNLIDFLLTDDEIYYYMNINDFYFSKEELDIIFDIIYQKYYNTYNFDLFF